MDLRAHEHFCDRFGMLELGMRSELRFDTTIDPGSPGAGPVAAPKTPPVDTSVGSTPAPNPPSGGPQPPNVGEPRPTPQQGKIDIANGQGYIDDTSTVHGVGDDKTGHVSWDVQNGSSLWETIHKAHSDWTDTQIANSINDIKQRNGGLDVDHVSAHQDIAVDEDTDLGNRYVNRHTGKVLTGEEAKNNPDAVRRDDVVTGQEDRIAAIVHASSAEVHANASNPKWVAEHMPKDPADAKRFLSYLNNVSGVVLTDPNAHPAERFKPMHEAAVKLAAAAKNAPPATPNDGNLHFSGGDGQDYRVSQSNGSQVVFTGDNTDTGVRIQTNDEGVGASGSVNKKYKFEFWEPGGGFLNYHNTQREVAITSATPDKDGFYPTSDGGHIRVTHHDDGLWVEERKSDGKVHYTRVGDPSKRDRL